MYVYIYIYLNICITFTAGKCDPAGASDPQKCKKTPRGGRTCRQNGLQHEVFEGVAAKNAGVFA